MSFDDIERKIKRKLFTEKDLIDILKIKDKRKKNKKITLLINKYKEDSLLVAEKFYGGELKKIQNMVFKEELSNLKQQGIKISPRERAALKQKFEKQFNKTQYFSHTPKARIKKAINQTAKRLKNDIVNLKKSSPESLEKNARWLVRKLKSDSGSYTVHGRSKRAIVSDLRRASSEFMLLIAEEKDIKYVRWVTQKDPKVAELDRKREKKITVSEKKLPGVDRRGVYTIAAAKKLVRHPFCRCVLRFVFAGG